MADRNDERRERGTNPGGERNRSSRPDSSRARRRRASSQRGGGRARQGDDHARQGGGAGRDGRDGAGRNGRDKRDGAGRDKAPSSAGSAFDSVKGSINSLASWMPESMFSGGSQNNRTFAVICLFCALAVLIVARLLLVQVFDVYGYADTAASIRTADETVFAKRGTIYDRNGNVLAMSVEATTVCCDPRQVTDSETTSQELAAILGGDPADYMDALTRDSGFSYIKRQADADVADAIGSRKAELREQGQTTTALDGIYCVDDTKRVYPYGTVAGQILGSVNVDGEGVSGLELEYDEILRGVNGEKSTERGRNGMDIPGTTVVKQEAVDGTDIMISIDVELQAAAEEALANQVEQSNANSGNLAIVDGDTGEIYATCSTPLFNPNDRSGAEEGAQSLKSMTAIYEPGSIFKPVTAAVLLEEGLASADEVITVPGYLDYGQWTITDAHDHGTQDMTFKQIIEQSSNIGITLLEDRVGSEKFYDYLLKYGFGTATGADYPGELDGRVSHYTGWSEVQEANISFGQGVSVTTIQMASFYGMVASGGKHVQPHFLIAYPSKGEQVSYESEQRMTSQTCEVLDDMLSGVVTDGTGSLAAIDGYTVAGKTGTSQKIEDDGSYSNSSYVISFDGYLPYTNSSLACAVSIDNPGTSAAMPVFSQVMKTAAEMYRITPE